MQHPPAWSCQWTTQRTPEISRESFCPTFQASEKSSLCVCVRTPYPDMITAFRLQIDLASLHCWCVSRHELRYCNFPGAPTAFLSQSMCQYTGLENLEIRHWDLGVAKKSSFFVRQHPGILVSWSITLLRKESDASQWTAGVLTHAAPKHD